VEADRLLIVSSANMEGWQVRRHRHTAIRFDGRTWRVASRSAFAGARVQYELVPISEQEFDAAGSLIDYNSDYVARRDRDARNRRHQHRGFVLLLMVSPILGFLSARTKARFEERYGIDPVRVTWHSMLVEWILALGALVLAAFGGLLFVPVVAALIIDALVRWDRILGEERPPPGFYEWLFRRRG
jgi:hypothetical protein